MDFVTFLQNNWFAIGGLITFAGFVWKVSKDIQSTKDDYKAETKEIKESISDLKKEFLDSQNEMNERIDSNHRELSERLDQQDEKRLESTERTRIIMDGVEATLISLHDDGHNGPVTKSLECIREYKSRKAAE